MTLTDELKILDNKIKANQAQYDLSREAAKISALSSKYLLESMNISLVKIQGADLVHLKKRILHSRVILVMIVFSIGYVTW